VIHSELDVLHVADRDRWLRNIGTARAFLCVAIDDDTITALAVPIVSPTMNAAGDERARVKSTGRDLLRWTRKKNAFEIHATDATRGRRWM
jgi:hypothetical protein